jgi:hypothetical protein
MPILPRKRVLEGWSSSLSTRHTSPGSGVQQRGENRLVWLKWSVVIALVAGLLLSAKLWVSTRAYPLVPLLDFVPPLPYPLDYLLLGLLGGLLVGVLLLRGRPSGAFVAAALVLAALLVVQDQGRLQPWFYQYSFMLGAVGLSNLGRLSTEGAMNTCRLIVAFTYLWSGLQKAHVTFAEDVYPWLMEPLTSRLSPGAVPALEYGAYAVPVIETAIGLGLLARPLRRPALVGAILMHVFILFSIGPWGHDWNSVVWPWNVAMMVFDLILFWRAPDNPSLFAVLKPGGSAFRTAVLDLFAFMPALNFFGMWDSYLSSSLYSGSVEQGYVYTTDGSSSTRTNIDDKAMEEMNVPAYPEERIYKRVFADIWCEESTRFPAPTLVVYGRPEIFSGQTSATMYRCEDVRRGSEGRQLRTGSRLRE